jgi:hypothetical protein
VLEDAEGAVVGDLEIGGYGRGGELEGVDRAGYQTRADSYLIFVAIQFDAQTAFRAREEVLARDFVVGEWWLL